MLESVLQQFLILLSNGTLLLNVSLMNFANEIQDAKGNEMGYRPLEIDDLELEQICTDIDVAESDKERLKHFKPLQDLFRRVNIANDECDYGMGLEFGISLFAHGSKYFHKMILKGTAYR